MAADCRSGDDSEPCTLRFASLRPGLTASVRWVDYEGEEKEYARLEEWVSATGRSCGAVGWPVPDAVLPVLPPFSDAQPFAFWRSASSIKTRT